MTSSSRATNWILRATLAVVTILLVGIRSDWLFAPEGIKALAGRLTGLGKEVEYRELDSPHGHDAFLKEWDQMTNAIGPFISAQSRGGTAE